MLFAKSPPLSKFLEENGFYFTFNVEIFPFAETRERHLNDVGPVIYGSSLKGRVAIYNLNLLNDRAFPR